MENNSLVPAAPVLEGEASPALNPFAGMSRREIAEHFGGRCGFKHSKLPGFRVTHPEDIAKAMLAALPFLIGAEN